jgi:hypothetical protein
MYIYNIYINKHKLTVNETDLHVFSKACYTSMYNCILGVKTHKLARRKRIQLS